MKRLQQNIFILQCNFIYLNIKFYTKQVSSIIYLIDNSFDMFVIAETKVDRHSLIISLFYLKLGSLFD